MDGGTTTVAFWLRFRYEWCFIPNSFSSLHETSNSNTYQCFWLASFWIWHDVTPASLFVHDNSGPHLIEGLPNIEPRRTSRNNFCGDDRGPCRGPPAGARGISFLGDSVAGSKRGMGQKKQRTPPKSHLKREMQWNAYTLNLSRWNFPKLYLGLLWLTAFKIHEMRID